MFKTILVPTDGSALSDKAISAAVELAKTTGGTIIGLSVAEPYPYAALAEASSIMPPDAGEHDEKMRKLGQQRVQKVAAAAAAANVPCQTVVPLSFDPSDEIVKAAKQFHCDLITMASHGRKGLNKLFLGSETQKVLAHSTIPVLVLR